jgi:hypothetical protein
MVRKSIEQQSQYQKKSISEEEEEERLQKLYRKLKKMNLLL